MEMYNTDCYRNREILDVVIQKKEELKQKQAENEEVPKEQVLIMRKTPEIVSRPSSRASKQNAAGAEPKPIEESKSNVSVQNDSVNLCINQTTNSLSILCFASTVILVLDVFVFLNSTNEYYAHGFHNGTLLTSAKDKEDLVEVFTAFSTIVIILSLNCILVCSMQCFIATKLLKAKEGHLRALKYFRECSSSRFVAVVGFFISFPLFLINLMLCVVLRLHKTHAITAVVVLNIGTLLGLLCMVQNIYHWYDEISSANRGFPVNNVISKSEGTEKDLNTLV